MEQTFTETTPREEIPYGEKHLADLNILQVLDAETGARNMKDCPALRVADSYAAWEAEQKAQGTPEGHFWSVLACRSIARAEAIRAAINANPGRLLREYF